jgi:hypothetical protein
MDIDPLFLDAPDQLCAMVPSFPTCQAGLCNSIGRRELTHISSLWRRWMRIPLTNTALAQGKLSASARHMFRRRSGLSRPLEVAP